MSENPDKTEARKISYREGWIAIIVNVVLFGLKYWVGIISGSVAIIADAWHTISDSFSSIVVLIGAKVSSKPADSSHPFGHGRAEAIAAIIIGMLLVFISFNFIVEGIGNLREEQAIVFSPIVAIIIGVSIVSKEGMAHYAIRAWKKTGKESLKADGWHHRSDAITSAIVFAGLFLSKHLWWIDSVLTFIVAALILYAAFEILRDTVSPLLGERPDEGLLRRISAIARDQAGGPVEVHHVHMHRYGDHTELTFHINLEKGMRLDEAHHIVDSIEAAIEEELDIDATIHVEPAE